MAQRGRVSADDRQAATQRTDKRPRRPAAPAELSTAQKLVWKKVVESQPPDWLPDGRRPLLAAYCSAVTAHAHIAKMVALEESKPASETDVEVYNKLLRMQSTQANDIARFAQRLGMAHDTSRNPPKQKNPLLE